MFKVLSSGPALRVQYVTKLIEESIRNEQGIEIKGEIENKFAA